VFPVSLLAKVMKNAAIKEALTHVVLIKITVKVVVILLLKIQQVQYLVVTTS
jgi:hypothetical protein